MLAGWTFCKCKPDFDVNSVDWRKKKKKKKKRKERDISLESNDPHEDENKNHENRRKKLSPLEKHIKCLGRYCPFYCSYLYYKNNAPVLTLIHSSIEENRLAKAIYSDAPITLSVLGNWLLHLPKENALNPPIRINRGQVHKRDFILI